MSRLARAVLALLLAPFAAAAQPRLELVASGLTNPLLAIAPPGDTERLFVVEQTGRVRIVRGGAVAATFLDLSGKISCCGERGLLGLAFHPAYFENGRLFVNYTDRSGNTVVSEYAVSADPDAADPGSERVILRQTQPFANHNGGNLAFSPRDGMLYVGLGDGGGAGDPLNNAQSDGTWLGKLLRLDVDRADPGRAYAVPPDNPFASAASPRAEQWAKGLRNPWRFHFDRLTYDLLVGDVGQNAREELDFQPAASAGGENYGWRLMEGASCYDPPAGCQAGVSLVLPVYQYLHTLGRCSITGGPAVRSAALPELEGRALFADFCTGEVFSLRLRDGAAEDVVNHTLEIAPGGGRSLDAVSSFGEDALGSPLVCDHADGEVYRLVSRAGTAARAVPVVVDSPGREGSRFSTALAVANTGASASALTFRYTAASSLGAAGSGSVSETLAAGAQLLLPDVVAWLRGKGLAIASGADARNAGSLLVEASGLSASGLLSVAARTSTPSGPGRAGVAYGATRPAALFAESALVFGLRESAAERSNLAVVNVGPDTLRLALAFRAASGGAPVAWPEELVLAPGEWRQLDSPLAALGLAGGTATVTRTSGSGPFDAYAVVNDNLTNDGSFLAAVRPLPPREDVIVPVLVETPRFASELVLHNPQDAPAAVTLRYVESLAGNGPQAEAVLELGPREQRIVPSALDLFRAQGAPVGAPGGSYAGTLTVSFRSAGRPMPGLAAVRVAAAAPSGGVYGVFLPGVPLSGTAISSVDLPGLTQDGSTRANVAVLHAGGSPAPITLRVEVFAADGRKAGELARTLAPLAWAQEDALLSRFGVAEGRVRVTRVAGTGRFLAYAVVNDGSVPGAGTGDGSALLGDDPAAAR